MVPGDTKGMAILKGALHVRIRLEKCMTNRLGLGWEWVVFSENSRPNSSLILGVSCAYETLMRYRTFTAKIRTQREKLYRVADDEKSSYTYKWILDEMWAHTWQSWYAPDWQLVVEYAKKVISGDEDDCQEVNTHGLYAKQDSVSTKSTFLISHWNKHQCYLWMDGESDADFHHMYSKCILYRFSFPGKSPNAQQL